jgi:hypothetical protein
MLNRAIDRYIFGMNSGCSGFLCFLEDQETAPPASLKTYPHVEFAPSVTADPPKSAFVQPIRYPFRYVIFHTLRSLQIPEKTLQCGLVMRLGSRHEATQCRDSKRNIWSCSDHQTHQCANNRTVAGFGWAVKVMFGWLHVQRAFGNHRSLLGRTGLYSDIG